ncbi:unnamed protein product [Discula destructiva]
MAGSNSPAQSSVTAADASRPFAPRQLIGDLLRTRHCVPGSVLLVEGIERHIPVSERYRAVRLLLGDGELCVQALLRPELHQFIDSGQVTVGCYVRLNKFEFRLVLAPRSNREATRHCLEEPEDFVFLVVRDLSIMGWNTAYMQMAGTTFQQLPTTTAGPGDQAGRQTSFVQEKGGPLTSPKPAVTEQSLVQSRAGVSEMSTESCNTTEAQRDRPGVSTSSCSASDNLPWASHDLSKPLKLTPLKSIPNLPYKQNWVVNILAVVASLSDVESATLPPFKQRTARLADPSTSKQVHLTVFLDPDNFAPAVGSVVLLLGVKNHRFDGGSLKKYGNEKRNEGSRWWLENPRDIDWCDVDGLEKWWSEETS